MTVSQGGLRLFGSIVSAESRSVRVFLVAVAAALTSLWLAPAAQGQAEPKVDESASGAEYVAGELVVTYKSDVSERALKEVPSEVDAESEETIPEIGVQELEFPEIQDKASGEDREKALARVKDELESDPAVASVDYNFIGEYSFTPDDTFFDRQYGLRKIKAPRAWNNERGAGVTIGIVDSGVDSGHPDLAGKITRQRDFINGDNTAEDDFGHGTAVSGVAAAATNNGRGVAGACPDCKLIVAKNGNNFPTTAATIRGIYWSVENGAKVVNLSLEVPRSEGLKRSVNFASRKGVVVVGAAGNEGSNRLAYPASYKNALSVAATNRRDKRASFSNFSRAVDLAAPGVAIRTTDQRGRAGFSGGAYSVVDGTSFSSPMVAGTAGLLAGQGRSAAQIRKRLQSTAKDLGADGRDNLYGHGLINAAAAVRRERTSKPKDPKPNKPRSNKPKEEPRKENLLDFVTSDEFPFGVLPEDFPFDFVRQ